MSFLPAKKCSQAFAFACYRLQAMPLFLAALLVMVMVIVTAATPAQAKIHKPTLHGAARQHIIRRGPGRIALLGTNPKFASFVMDANTGAVLHQDDPDKIVHPASLTKMMTLLVLFQALNEGRTTLRSPVRISAFAHSMAPSKLDIPVGSSISVENAIYAIVTHSANDIAVAVGEHVGGSQPAFIAMMNRKAAQLGMSHTNYVNACGLHSPQQVTSARDQAILARALIYSYPQYYHYFSTPSFFYGGRRYANHNHLMETYPGMDGIKTGYIIPSGFNLVASAKHGSRRLIGVIFGGQSAKGRDAQMAKLLNDAFAQNSPPILATTAQAFPAPLPPLQLPGQATGQVAYQPAVRARPSNERAGQVKLIQSGVPQPARPYQVPPSPQQQAAITPASGSARILPVPANTLQIASTPAYAPAAASTANAIPQPGINQGWAIQIGTYSTQARTAQALQSAMNVLPAELHRATPVITPLQTVNGMIFRGRLNGFSRADALRACGLVPDCLTVSPNAN